MFIRMLPTPATILSPRLILLIDRICWDITMNGSIRTNNASMSNGAAFQHCGMGCQSDMISNLHRCVSICGYSLSISNSMVVAVINHNASSNHHIASQVNTLCCNQNTITIHCKKLTVNNTTGKNLNY